MLADHHRARLASQHGRHVATAQRGTDAHPPFQDGVLAASQGGVRHRIAPVEVRVGARVRATACSGTMWRLGLALGLPLGLGLGLPLGLGLGSWSGLWGSRQGQGQGQGQARARLVFVSIQVY